MLNNSPITIIINSKGDFAGESDELKELAKLMNDEEVSLNEQFIWAQNRVNELNQDRRASIVSYETNKLDWTLYGDYFTDDELEEFIAEAKGKTLQEA
ncbi:hypothetical protein FC52_GL000603 [Lactobacillus pasteurii DSM 23907 = CRBIP 24.76]|uniref:Uncharacterized protein n=1 Tax=Lactobacillus pasteurii DSM 23907 = CRBIP 24.76 TaxID=1423790 RepID=I7LER6_9LACO|nr:hypothetical protein [Lactobacillus pasteurii]KRK08902.1 hypothetical protein FC52_GL000603 [Lactobacillus pasteurii DSM 23907 = CRBIP 24.76]TDG76262.1 hypothetical protein C5L33_001021 [Lactobacillus pasteurii]CCI86013.1 Putative uncharacterized protein [Lactobacillus pasteurii DSM 23907 = CRBIP 24.76]